MRLRTWMIVLALLAALMGQCADTANPAPEISAASATAQLGHHGCDSESSQ
jgi:hypothetical protein